MKLPIKVSLETGVIEDARFKTFGCGLRERDRVIEPRHGGAEGQDDRRGGQDQEH
jgi:hypothetical protein